MDVIPIITVLMPVYNGEKFLREAIDSILSQTFTDFELLIINDGSNDQSETIVKSYNDERIRYVCNSTNLKLIATLNNGLSLARGKYIARMDADDVSEPERLQVQFEHMEANPDCGLCGTDITILSKHEVVSSNWIKTGTHDALKYNLLMGNPFCHPTVMIRSEVLRSRGLNYNPDHLHAEEYGLWIALSRSSRLANLNSKLLRYRLHDAQVSAVHRKQQLDTLRKIKSGLFREITLFTSKRWLDLFVRLTAIRYNENIPDGRLIHDDLMRDGFLTSGRNRLQLRIWIYMIKFSLLFRREWNNTYTRCWLNNVSQAISIYSR
jgi:glycosyltransferase involved in cell wall biosynthesis